MTPPASDYATEHRQSAGRCLPPGAVSKVFVTPNPLAMVAGDKRPYLVGLIVPDAEWALEWAKANGEKYDFKALQELPAFRSAVRAAVDRRAAPDHLPGQAEVAPPEQAGRTKPVTRATPASRPRNHRILAS